MFLLRIGPLDLAEWHLILIGLALAFVIWVLRGLTLRISGTWTRVDQGEGNAAESIAFVQFGPFVRGRRMVKGGFQEFTGLLRGRTIFLTRRDHGRELIVNQGFPKELVAEIDGTVTAKLRLTLSADGKALFGTFTPQKIEFTHRPPEITNRLFLEPSHRRYTLTSREVVAADVPTDPAPNKKSPVRRTM